MLSRQVLLSVNNAAGFRGFCRSRSAWNNLTIKFVICQPRNIASFSAQARSHALRVESKPFAVSFGSKAKTLNRVGGLAVVMTIGLGLSSLSKPTVVCDSPTIVPRAYDAQNPPPPVSSVSVYELSFGTVCGICAGVFIKKGAKVVAFFLGGAFVILQYFGSLSLLRVNWSRVQTGFENLLYKTDANGVRRPPTITSLWNWLTNFLLSDFQPRASFLAGLVLGLRIG